MAGLLLALLALLATLQYRWLGEVSQLEGERMEAAIQAAAEGFATELDREVTRAFLQFFPPRQREPAPLGPHYAAALEQWRETAPYPRLVRELVYARRTEGEWSLECLEAAAGRFASCPWPPELPRLRRRLEAAAPREEPVEPPRFRPLILAEEVPALALPVLDFPAPSRDRETGREPTLAGYVVILLDQDYLREELLPALGARHFSAGGGAGYDFAVLEGDWGGEVLFTSNPALPPEAYRSADVELGVLTLLHWDELRRLALGSGESWRSLRPLLAAALESGEPLWRLVVRHRAGSLERAVAATRRRNLVVGFGVLLLLLLAVGFLWSAARRAQRLAGQQMEFVAGISHDVRTPLAAIRSLAQNLADGIVAEPEQVRRYGTALQREGERLSRMAEQILEFSGIAANTRTYALEPVAVTEIVEGALADNQLLLEEEGVEVELDLAPGLPPLLADAQALRRALSNLIDNAVKYGGEARWLGIRAGDGDGPAGPEVALQVSDRGPGIPAGEHGRLFEPFYRRRQAVAAQIRGSGLGLSLVRHIVEAHGGRVEVRSESGRGSTFTLHLPALREERHGERQDPAGRG